jgi:hypothetical protein
MEAPVAAALGKVDAINLFDPYWSDVEYDLWYGLLNCGIKLPASTGSDWFVCSANRIYAQSGRSFEYAKWLDAVRQGRTFITNGPALHVTVNEIEPGATVSVRPGESLEVEVEWQSHYPVERIEVVMNGKVAGARSLPLERSSADDGAAAHAGALAFSVPASSDGWIAARLASSSRDSFNQAIWAHTSPVYMTTGRRSSPERKGSARYFADQIDQALAWTDTGAKFYTDAQRKEVQDLFRAGQDYYRKLTR